MAKKYDDLPLPTLMIICLLISMQWTVSLSSRDQMVLDDHDSTLADMFEEWMQNHSRVYNSVEEKVRRFKIFKRTVKRVYAHNQLKMRTYDLAVNQFADLSDYERLHYHTGFNYPEQFDYKNRRCRAVVRNSNFTANFWNRKQPVDWRAMGAVTPVQNQGSCNSCWAFATVAAIESRSFIATRKLTQLSVQQLVDCDRYDHGCTGGLLTTALKWIRRSGGLTTAEEYPYTGEKGRCKQEANPSTKIKCFDVHSYIDEKRLESLVDAGPVITAINVAPPFLDYKVGIYRGPCTTEVNHAVTIVGYGATPYGEKYWVIKNSYGSEWGLNGYGMLQKDSGIIGGMCGLAVHVVVPHVK